MSLQDQKNSRIKKVFVFGHDNVGWSIDADHQNTSRLFSESDEFILTHNIFSADIVYCVWYDVLIRPHYRFFFTVLKSLFKIKILAVVTNNVQQTPEKVLLLRKLIDVWVAPNKNIQTFLVNQGVSVIHLPFLVDTSLFQKSTLSKNNIAQALDLDIDLLTNTLLIGSIQRDTLQNLIEPKWQKNPDLLIQIVTRLPKNSYRLVIAGPRRHYLVNTCRALNIPYVFIGNERLIHTMQDDLLENNLPLEKVNLLYNLIDCYLVTSKSEGGPKSVLECALTKTLIFSTPVGLSTDVLHPNLIYTENEIESLTVKILALIKNKTAYTNEMQHNFTTVSKILDSNRILQIIKKQCYEN